MCQHNLSEQRYYCFTCDITFCTDIECIKKHLPDYVVLNFNVQEHIDFCNTCFTECTERLSITCIECYNTYKEEWKEWKERQEIVETEEDK